MNKTMKRKSIIFASVACAVLTGSAFGVLGMNSNTAIQASAETTTLTESSFVMPGASVRIATDKNGIRFPVWLPEKVYEANQTSIIETGTLLCPKAMYDSTQLTVEAYQSATSKTDGAITTDKWVEYTDPKTGTVYYQSMIYLYNIPSTDMETEIMARGYVKIGEQTLYSPIITRSMAEVAYQAMQDPDYASHSTTLQGYLGNYVVELDAQENAFEVYSAVNTPNNLVYDLSSYATVTEASVAVVVDGERALVDSQYVTVADNKVTVSGAAFGASVYGDVDLQIITDNKAFETSVNVVTKYISTKADLDNLYQYGGMDATAADKSYDGYFVMTRNIDCANTVLAYRDSNDYLNRNATAQYQDYQGEYGFRGIFDGQGYKIYNMKLEGQHLGLFGNMAKGSVLKNVALVGNQYYTHWDSYVIAETISGTVSNCYIDFVLAQTGTNTSEYKLLAAALQHSTLSDLVIKYDTSAKTQGQVAYLSQYAGGGYAYSNGQMVNSNFFQNVAQTSNVYVFTQTDRAWIDGWNNTGYEWVWKPMMNNIVKNDYDAQIDPVTMSDPTYWNLEGDQPIFKSVGGATRTINYMGDTYQTTAFEVYDNVTVNYTGAHYEATVSSYTLTPNTFSVDLSGYDLPENPTSIKLVGEKASKNIGTNCFSNGVLTIADLGSDIYGEVSVEFTTADCIYKVSSFNVVTKYIDKTADLGNIYFYGGWDVENRTTFDYDGYFVMRANVGSLGSALSYRSANALWTNAGYAYYYGDAGFKGIFDGQGHTIQYAMWGGFYNTTGIFGSTQKGSEIKNVKFEGSIFEVNDTMRGGFLLGRSISSKITNCYFDISAKTGNTTKEFAALAMYMTYAQLKDVVIKADFSNMISTCPTASWLCYGPGNMENANDGGWWNGPSNAVTFENVYVFTDATQGWIFNYSNTSSIADNASINALDAVVSGVTMTDSTYWNLTGNQPVWKGVSA